MAIKITLSGVYSDPEAGPLTGVTLNFTTINNSCQTQRQSQVSTTTDENAFYTISLVPNVYSVCEIDQRWNRKELGLIHIFADSKPGTLNEYLVAFPPDNVQPGILQAMRETFSATQQHATMAQVATQEALAAERAATEQAALAAAQRAAAEQAATGAATAAQVETGKLAERLATDGSELTGHGATTIANVLSSHGATTSSQGIGFSPDDNPDLTTDHSAALQKMLNTYKYIVFDTVVNCAGTVNTGGVGQVISATGIGELRPIGSAMKNKPLLVLAHERCLITKMLLTNPLLLKSQTGNRQCAVEIQSDNCTVHDSMFINQQSGVLAPAKYAPAGTKVLGNRFLDCLGAGDGEGNLTSSYGEDRGDACSVWGSSTIIANNHAECKTGEDARIAFHAEYPVSDRINPREFDGCNSLMVGNYARGAFRRHFAMEGVTNGLMVGNISAGGATWWAISLTQCTNVKSANQIYWDNTGSTAGASWNPLRGAIGILNFNKKISVDDDVVFSDDAVGFGFVTATQTGEHNFDLSARILCSKNTKYGAYLLRPKLARLEGVKISGAECGYKFVGTSGGIKYIPTVYDSGSFIDTTKSCIRMDFGTGGRWIARNCEYICGGDEAISFSNMDEIVLHNCTINALSRAATIFAAKKLKITGCSSNNETALAVELNRRTSGEISGDWLLHDNTLLALDFYYPPGYLSNISSTLNLRNKWPGRIICTQNDQWVSCGSTPAAAWLSLTTGKKILPAEPEPTEETE
ncbi:hypothetical protein C7M52_00446 [Mixta theicola]|nr:prophage tail fiber N-terminal domain-containing protein [Mixta theicola]QHM74511.1 hypothetical protein C7M52_00446 [Mixta theicola]